MNRILVAFVVCIIHGACGFAVGEDQIDARTLLFKLDNSHVSWDFFMGYIAPSISKETSATLRQLRKADLPKLQEMLADREKFMVAHVLLAEVYRTDLKLSADRFYGMKVQFNRDGAATYPDYDAKRLQEYWKKTAEAHASNVDRFFADQRAVNEERVKLGLPK